MLMSHLSQNIRMILRQTIGKGAKTGHGLGRNLQGIQMVISSAPKRNRYGIGFQLEDQRKNGRMGSQKENRTVRSNLIFLPLDWTFRSGGYINFDLSEKDQNLVAHLLALTINEIKEDEKTIENTCPIVYPCLSDFELNNWSIVEILIVHKSSE